MALLAVDNFDDVIACLASAKRELSDSLSAIEYMDAASFNISLDYLQMENPFRDREYNFYLLIEASGN